MVEELGRAAFPCPLLSTLSVSYLLTACGAAGEPALEAIAEGATAALVLSDEHGSWEPAATPVGVSGGQLMDPAILFRTLARSVTSWFVPAPMRGSRYTGWRLMPKA